MNAFSKGRWKVKAKFRPDLQDDPMGEYVVEPAQTRLTRLYENAEPESPELEAVHAENDANRRLIEAAPTMFHALQAAEKTIREGYSKQFSDKQVEEHCPAFRIVRRAIKRASLRAAN